MNGTLAIAPPEWDLLLSAAAKNDPDLLKRLLAEQGVNPSHANAVGQSALHIASLWGHVECMEALLEAGANVRAQNNMTGATPLHMVAQSHKASTDMQRASIEVLVKYGADISQTDSLGRTPLNIALEVDSQSPLRDALTPDVPAIFVALENKDVDELERLLKEDPTLKETTYCSRNLLVTVVFRMLATNDFSMSWFHVLNTLVGHGVDSNSAFTSEEGVEGVPIYHLVLAARKLYKEQEQSGAETSINEVIISLELMTARLYQAEKQVPTELSQLLHDAARRNEVQLAKLLIAKLGVDPNLRNRQGMTPLQFAARSGQCEMIKFLLEQEEIDVEAMDNQGRTALDAAVANDKLEAVALLQNYAFPGSSSRTF